MQHGFYGTRTYKIWADMKQRCVNPNSTGYKYYGGRGISYHPDWENFVNFLRDMGEADGDVSLDRIDSERDYCKENCRWATDDTQQNNRRNNVIVTFQGVEYTIKELSELTGISRDVLRERVYKKWPINKVVSFSQPLVTVYGVTSTIAHFCRKYKKDYGLVALRYRRGWAIERALFGDVRPVSRVIVQAVKEHKEKLVDQVTIGQTYGLLTTVAEADTQKSHRMLLCKCSCGNTKDVRADDLLRGQVKSCGCLKPRGSVKIGDKFNRLTVKEAAPRTSADARWLCTCDCGKETIVPQYKMTRGIIMSCGCLNAELTAERNRTRHQIKPS